MHGQRAKRASGPVRNGSEAVAAQPHGGQVEPRSTRLFFSEQSHGQGPSGGQVGPGQVGPVTGSSSQSKAMAKGPLAGRLAQGRLAQKQALLLRAKPWLRALWRAGWPWADRPGKRW